jgi:hypothetical protein
MMHHRVADQNHFHNLFLPPGRNILNHSTQKITNDSRQFGAVESEADAAHNVGAMHRLGIESSSEAEQLACSEVQQLRHNGCGAEIDGNTKPLTPRSGKLRIVD